MLIPTKWERIHLFQTLQKIPSKKSDIGSWNKGAWFLLDDSFTWRVAISDMEEVFLQDGFIRIKYQMRTPKEWDGTIGGSKDRYFNKVRIEKELGNTFLGFEDLFSSLDKSQKKEVLSIHGLPTDISDITNELTQT